MNHQNDYCIVMTTYNNKGVGDCIIQTLLSEKLAACIQTFPIKSSYTWKGEVQTDNENILYIKTKNVHYEEIISKIKSIHDYECPEIIKVPIDDGSNDYLAWIDQVCK